MTAATRKESVGSCNFILTSKLILKLPKTAEDIEDSLGTMGGGGDIDAGMSLSVRLDIVLCRRR